jgi:hypothetical protein
MADSIASSSRMRPITARVACFDFTTLVTEGAWNIAS